MSGAEQTPAPPVRVSERPYTVAVETDDRDEWLAVRRQTIGASEIATILGENPWGSPLEVYSRKIGASEERAAGEAAEWGLKLEPVIARTYAERTGRKVRRPRKPLSVLVSTVHPWASCTLDGWTIIPECEDPESPLELKTVGHRLAEVWADGPPRWNWWQVQQQLLVTGCVRASMACLVAGQRLVWCDVTRDEAALAYLVREGERFWERVQSRWPPEPDDSWEARQALSVLYPREAAGQAVTLSSEYLDIDDELERLREEKKGLEGRIRGLENKLKAAIGEAETAVLPNHVVYGWKTIERGGYYAKPTSYRKLTRHAPRNLEE